MPTIPGTAGPDTLNGTTDPDLIEAGAGNDVVSGGDGDDTLNGDSGNDTVDGGAGADLLYWDEDAGATGASDSYSGGAGGDNFNDDPYSYTGGDTLNLGHAGAGAAGFDVIFTDSHGGTATDGYGNLLNFGGFERVVTGDGSDSIDASGATAVGGVGIRLRTGGGEDTILGSAATDYIHAGAGDDLIHGGDGNDVIEAGAGDDTIYGEDGWDGIRWGDGNYDGPIGNDVFYGGSGFNTLNAWQYNTSGTGVTMVLTSSDSGTVDMGSQGHLDFYEFQNLLTGHGQDTVDGSGAGANGFRTFTASGDDSIIGSVGDDQIEGGDGADTIEGGAGDDWISMAGDLYSMGHAWEDYGSDLLVLADGFGNDTVRAFNIEDSVDEWGGPLPMDRLDVSGLNDADGNPVDLGDVVVSSFTDARGTHAMLGFPNGETVVLYEIDPADLTRAKLHELGIPCFCEGTLIAAHQGEVAVERLKVGDLVMTRDHGLRPIRWIGCRRLDRIDLAVVPHLQPIRIRKDALAPGMPNRDLLVSPQHRVLVRSNIAQRMFGCAEVLVAAKQLLAIEGIEQVCASEVAYYHILFDQHEIVLSNGAETESLYTGPQALKAVGAHARKEIFLLFPELRKAPAEAARPLIPGARAQRLAHRHARNGKDLVNLR